MDSVKSSDLAPRFDLPYPKSREMARLPYPVSLFVEQKVMEAIVIYLSAIELDCRPKRYAKNPIEDAIECALMYFKNMSLLSSGY